jgi:hypothetical protein
LDSRCSCIKAELVQEQLEEERGEAGNKEQ